MAYLVLEVSNCNSTSFNNGDFTMRIERADIDVDYIEYSQLIEWALEEAKESNAKTNRDPDGVWACDLNGVTVVYDGYETPRFFIVDTVHFGDETYWTTSEGKEMLLALDNDGMFELLLVDGTDHLEAGDYLTSEEVADVLWTRFDPLEVYQYYGE